MVNNQLVPTTSPQAVTYGLDLNGDTIVDNQLGAVIATLAGQDFDVQGSTDTALFDTTPKDCVITLDEIRNSPLIRSLLAPDVLINGQAALSLGFAVTATRAAFMP